MAKDTEAIRCAIYTRKSHEEGLDQEFNSLDAQRQAGEAYIESQRHEGWRLLPDRYDDGGFSGGTMERPALSQLIRDIRARKIDCVVVYKVDRLSRSLLDFSQVISLFDEHEVSFVSVTQQFNTTTSMGRLTLNILLSFAQFEREIIGERIRDKKLATARQGKYVGGQPVLGLDIVDRRYVVNQPEAKLVRRIFQMLLEHESCRKVGEALNAEGLVTKQYQTKTGKLMGGRPWRGRTVHNVVTDRKYLGQIVHKGDPYEGEHPAIVDLELFNKVKRVLAANKTYTHKHQTQRFSLLRRLIRCGHCGSLVMPTFTTNHGREYRYYNCRKRTQTGYVNCPLPTIPAAQLESAVVDQVREVLRHPEVIARTLRQVEQSGGSHPEEFTGEALRRVDPVWDVLYPEEQHRILTILIDSIKVSTIGLKIGFRDNGIEQIVEELGNPVTASPASDRNTSEPTKKHQPSIIALREDGADRGSRPDAVVPPQRQLHRVTDRGDCVGEAGRPGIRCIGRRDRQGAPLAGPA